VLKSLLRATWLGKYCNDHVIKERGDKVLELEFVSVD
jgi:hypothetical protein